MSAINLLHSEYSGVGRIWTKEEGTTSRFFPHGPTTQPASLQLLTQKANCALSYDLQLR
jgi:hypothetical protein